MWQAFLKRHEPTHKHHLTCKIVAKKFTAFINAGKHVLNDLAFWIIYTQSPIDFLDFTCKVNTYSELYTRYFRGGGVALMWTPPLHGPNFVQILSVGGGAFSSFWKNTFPVGACRAPLDKKIWFRKNIAFESKPILRSHDWLSKTLLFKTWTTGFAFRMFYVTVISLSVMNFTPLVNSVERHDEKSVLTCPS